MQPVAIDDVGLSKLLASGPLDGFQIVDEKPLSKKNKNWRILPRPAGYAAARSHSRSRRSVHPCLDVQGFCMHMAVSNGILVSGTGREKEASCLAQGSRSEVRCSMAGICGNSIGKPVGAHGSEGGYFLAVCIFTTATRKATLRRICIVNRRRVWNHRRSACALS